jgi:hypothetical protein
MNVSRLVSLAATLVINATAWQAFSSLPVHAQTVAAVSAPVVDASGEAALQEIVVIGHRPS